MSPRRTSWNVLNTLQCVLSVNKTLMQPLQEPSFPKNA